MITYFYPIKFTHIGHGSNSKRGWLIRQAWRGPVYWRPNDQAAVLFKKIETMRTEIVLSTWVLALALGIYSIKKVRWGWVLTDVFPNESSWTFRPLGVTSFGRFVPWTFRPLDDVFHGRCVPDQCVPTLYRCTTRRNLSSHNSTLSFGYLQ